MFFFYYNFFHIYIELQTIKSRIKIGSMWQSLMQSTFIHTNIFLQFKKISNIVLLLKSANIIFIR